MHAYQRERDRRQSNTSYRMQVNPMTPVAQSNAQITVTNDGVFGSSTTPETASIPLAVSTFRERNTLLYLGYLGTFCSQPKFSEDIFHSL